MIDLCPDRKDYYSQLNNKLDPQIACQCEAAAQCIDLVDDVRLLAGPHDQPGDNLRFFCSRDAECALLCRHSHPGSSIHPAEWADVLVFAINKLTGYKCARFEGNLTAQTVNADLEAGLPTQASLRFSGIAGHYVSVVGRTDNGSFIINDPYKDWLHGKSDGFHCLYTMDEWKEHSKGYGIRYARRK
jgi:hypothetical protein